MHDEFNRSLVREMGRLRALVEIEGTSGRTAPRLSESGMKFICDKLTWLCHVSGGNDDCPVRDCPFADKDGKRPCFDIRTDDWKTVYACGRVFGNRPRRDARESGDKAAVNGVHNKGGQRAASPFWSDRAMCKRMKHRGWVRDVILASGIHEVVRIPHAWSPKAEAMPATLENNFIEGSEAKPITNAAPMNSQTNAPKPETNAAKEDSFIPPFGEKREWTSADEWNEMEDRIRCAEMRRAAEDLELRKRG